jgi:DNA-binding MarR family transcriptional regulator
MDDELGFLHGLSWTDFVLLTALDGAGGSISYADLARKLGVSGSRLLLQIIPLEKIGLLTRSLGNGGPRKVSLRPNGRLQVREATETAERICEDCADA